MDDRRFDRLARAAARGTSRRQLVRQLVGGLAATAALGLGARRVAAQDESYLGLGAPCYSDWQCDQSDQPVYCADNQFGYDSPYNCCLGQFGFCGYGGAYADSYCCGSMVCDTGYCNYPGSGPRQQGESCQSDVQCGSLRVFLTCDTVGFDGSGARRCCAGVNSPCDTDDGCCSGAVCRFGTCQY